MSLATERRAARERVLGLLYEAEAKSLSGADVLDALPVPADDFAVSLVRAVDEHRTRIDGLLEQFAQGWSLRRMPALDRAALRMGTAELLVRADVPTGVVLSETVDLASRFGTEASGRFVNGLLARIAQEVRPGGDVDVPVAPVEETEPVAQVAGLVIDLDGVIRHWDPSHYSEAEEHLGLPEGTITAAAFAGERLERAMDGRTSFTEWCREIGDDVAGAHGVEAALIAETWAEAGWTIDLSVIDLVAAVRRRVPVALLSNASTNLITDLERSGIAGEFDAVIGSADLGAAKPSAAAFRAAAGAIGVPLEACLFVDDTAGHVDGARAIGMRAEVFTDVQGLEALFRELGLL